MFLSHIDVSLPLSPFLPLSLKSKSMSLGENIEQINKCYKKLENARTEKGMLSKYRYSNNNTRKIRLQMIRTK